jgi:glutamate dehydrogenase (NAD(P)+)
MFDMIDEWGPEKIVCVSDTPTGMRGVLVIDNTARGMGKGGTRMSPTVSVAEVAQLARNMTWKWAGVDLRRRQGRHPGRSVCFLQGGRAARIRTRAA